MRSTLIATLFFTSLSVVSAQVPTVDNVRILSGDQLVRLRTFLEQSSDIMVAKNDGELLLRLSQFQTSAILFDKSATPGSKFWYTDRNSSLPTPRDFVDPNDHQYLIDYVASGLHKRGFSVSRGGVVIEMQMVTRNETRTVTEIVKKPVEQIVTETIMTPTGPKNVQKKVIVYVEEKVQKTVVVPVSMAVPVEKLIAPPTEELNALLNELNGTTNPIVKKTLERMVGAKFAEQYPPGKTVPGAESAIVLADQYRLSVLNDAKNFLAKQSSANGAKAIGEPLAFGQRARSTTELLQNVNGAMPSTQFDVGSERFACVWQGSTLVAVRVSKQPTIEKKPIVLGDDWKPREVPPKLAPAPIPAPVPATKPLAYPNHRTK